MDNLPPPSPLIPPDLSHPQQEALRKAYGILSEHFHNALIVVGAKLDAPDNAPATHSAELTRVSFVGSHKEALGNCAYANAYLFANLRNCIL